MTGKKGMRHTINRRDTLRRDLWRSMRIMRQFTINGLITATPGATYGNARKFLASLAAHGYVEKTGAYTTGRAGEQQQYRLKQNPGPNYPNTCATCGQPLTKICAGSGKEKETKKEEETGGDQP
jgi:hypothetical protein